MKLSTIHIDTLEIFEKVLSKYNIGNLIDYKELGGWANTNFKVDTTIGSYVFKIHEQYQDNTFELELEFLRTISRYNVPVPHYIRTKNGKSHYKYKDFFISIKEWVEGNQPTEILENDAINIAKQLAILHNIKISSKNSKPTWLEKNWIENTLLELSKVIDTSIFYKRLHHIDIKAIYKLPMSITHGDVHSKNIILTNQEKLVLIDWEEVGFAPAVLDLCIFISSVDNIQIEQKILSAYQLIRPFTDSEKYLFYDVFKLAQIIQKIWFAKEYYINKKEYLLPYLNKENE